MTAHSDLQTRLEAIKAHGFPFPVIRAVLRAHEIPTAQGWDSQVSKLIELETGEAKRARALLARAHEQLTLYSEKAFQLFEVTEGHAIKLARALRKYTFSNVFAERFPFDLTASDLSTSQKRLSPAALYIEADTSEFVEDEPLFFDSSLYAPEAIPTLVLSGKRYRTFRNEIEISQMNNVPDSLDGFDYVIAVRREVLQFNHCVALLNFSGRWFVELRLDNAIPWLAGELDKHFLFVKERVNTFYKKKLDTNAILLTGAVNLFPSISALYQSTDGIVRQAGSVASSASVRDEKMRRAGLDLRKDSFHANGVKATGFEGFSVQKSWNSNVYETTPSIILPGTVSKASMEQPYLGHGVVTGAACQADYLLVMQRLLRTI